MLTKSITTGNIIPIISYFTNDFSIHEKANRLQIFHALYNGADAIFSLGSTGEALYLKSKENIPGKLRAKLMLIQLESIFHYESLSKASESKNIPFLVGIYGETGQECEKDLIALKNQTKTILKEESKRFPNLIKKFGVDNTESADIFEDFVSGIVIPPPKKKLLDENGLFQFFSSILARVKIPVYLYNNPSTFGNNIITPKILSDLIPKYPNLFGIKDSSGELENKIAYCQFLSERFSVSCGKEGMVGDFLLSIEKDLRKFAGIVPSIGNLTNTPSEIVKNAIKGNDERVKELQNFMNSYRGHIYDSEVPKGKAQRGLKRAFQQIYSDRIEDIPAVVSDEFIRTIPEETISLMEKTVQECLNDGVLKLYPKAEEDL